MAVIFTLGDAASAKNSVVKEDRWMATTWKVVHNSGIAADLESQTRRIVVRRPKTMPDADFARFLTPGTHVNDDVLRMIENWDVIPPSVDNRY